MFRPKLTLWLPIALFAAWLASCSSDVDGYHIVTAELNAGAVSNGPDSAVGGSQNGGAGGAAKGGSQSGGAGTGGRDLDARADGDARPLIGSGGSPAGGAGGSTGGAETGGAQNGGGGGGGTGGAQSGGAGGNTGGAPTGGVPSTGGAGGAGGVPTGGRPSTGGATGGAPTGGAPTGGAPTGGAPTGGAPTGGAPTGGAPTGGAPTGGAPTGGAPTGGAPTGGAPTGGAPTGGAPTGGAGGTGGYPGDPVNVPLMGASVSAITAAAWEPASHLFYLLKPSTQQYFTLSPTTGAVTGPTALQGTGTVAGSAFGASATDVFFVRGTSLVRQPISGGTALQVSIGSVTLATLSGAYAKGWFLLGATGGASQGLQDGTMILDSGATGLANIHVVATDTDSFGFRLLGGANRAMLHRVTPGTFTANSTPCDAGAFNGNIDASVGVYDSNVAWVLVFPTASYQYRLNVATIASGSCNFVGQTDFATSTAASQAVGLIDPTHALVTSLANTTSATVEILQVGGGSFSRAPLNVNWGTSGFPVIFVVGKETTTHFAVLVTKSVPVLISF